MLLFVATGESNQGREQTMMGELKYLSSANLELCCQTVRDVERRTVRWLGKKLKLLKLFVVGCFMGSSCLQVELQLSAGQFQISQLSSAQPLAESRLINLINSPPNRRPERF